MFKVQLRIFNYSKTCVKRPLSKRPKIGFQDQLSLDAGQKYCRMLQGEHSAILSTFIKLPFVIKIFVLSIFGWSFYTGFTVIPKSHGLAQLYKQILLSYRNVLQSWDINVHHLVTLPFKTVLFQNFYKIYCCKTIQATTMKKVPNESQLT